MLLNFVGRYGAPHAPRSRFLVPLNRVQCFERRIDASMEMEPDVVLIHLSGTEQRIYITANDEQMRVVSELWQDSVRRRGHPRRPVPAWGSRPPK